MKQDERPLEGLREDQRAAMGKLLESREAQAVARLLQQAGGDSLRTAAQSAAQGDGAALRAILAKMMADPAGARAVEALRKKTE